MASHKEDPKEPSTWDMEQSWIKYMDVHSSMLWAGAAAAHNLANITLAGRPIYSERMQVSPKPWSPRYEVQVLHNPTPAP